jgi:aryl-alcohol dehydrogenase-like predicted oxidoreductase
VAAAGAGTLIRGGAAGGGLAEDKNWRQGPLGLAEVEGQRRWAASGVEDLVGDITHVEFVLRFTLSHPALSSTIVGTSKIDHLRANLSIAAKGPLPSGLLRKAKQCLTLPAQNPEPDASPVPGPV